MKTLIVTLILVAAGKPKREGQGAVWAWGGGC